MVTEGDVELARARTGDCLLPGAAHSRATAGSPLLAEPLRESPSVHEGCDLGAHSLDRYQHDGGFLASSRRSSTSEVTP